MLAQEAVLNAAPLVLQPLRLDWLRQAGIEVALLRLDLLDEALSGNKWFKLQGHLAVARQQGADTLISLGGPHSNHLHALAAAGRRFGYRTVGLLRGPPQDTPTVQDLTVFGMHLHWLGYGGYRDRLQPGFASHWLARYPGAHFIPEGGGGLIGAVGCGALVERVRPLLEQSGWEDYSGWWLAAGTGTTLAGLVMAEGGRHRVYGALAGPGQHGVAQRIGALLAEAQLPDRGYCLVEACRGGFGRFDAELAGFMFESECLGQVPLEPVYTAKALLALRSYIADGHLVAGSRLIFVHTGGLQGRRAALPQLERLLAGQTLPEGR